MERDSPEWKKSGPSRCDSRQLFKAFIASGHECVAKPMPEDDLTRLAYNLRHYLGEFGDIGISIRNGKLFLYQKQ